MPDAQPPKDAVTQAPESGQPGQLKPPADKSAATPGPTSPGKDDVRSAPESGQPAK